MKLDIRIAAPVPLGVVRARLELASGRSQTVVLDHGRYQGEVDGRPVRLQLLETAAAEDQLAPEPPRAVESSAPDGDLVDVQQLFDQGLPVPPDGRLHLQLVWGAPCHAATDTAEGRRFGSFEHTICAARVGLDDSGQPLAIGGVDCWVTAETPLSVGAHRLTFGEVVALAGDFYAHLDERAAQEFHWAWPDVDGFVGWLVGDYRKPTLTVDGLEGPRAVLAAVELERNGDGPGNDVSRLLRDSFQGSYPARRYLALASQNFCHFASQPPDGTTDDGCNLGLRLYRAYHQRALAEAREGARSLDPRKAFERALVTDAFGCHFLTDLFASGHIRVPRRAIAEQCGFLRAARLSHRMHQEDNQLGLWCVARAPAAGARRVWRAYGDGMLRTEPAAAHLAQVREAVRRSSQEIFAAYLGAAPVRGSEAAEALIPVPLAPGKVLSPLDDVLGGAERRLLNHYPLVWLLDDGRLALRDGGPTSHNYRVGGSEPVMFPS
jgi:hypothetical protein